jgi:hypothetical protein
MRKGRQFVVGGQKEELMFVQRKYLIPFLARSVIALFE